jgi:cell division protein FtsQ
MFALQTIEIQGAPPRAAAHVRAALQPLGGSSLLAIDSSDVMQRLDRLPDVAAVTYDRDFPHTLRLDVVPAHTIAVVRRGAAAWLVSSDARVIRSSERSAAPLLPRIWLAAEADPNPGQPLDDRDGERAIAALANARRARFASRVFAVRATDDELTFVLQNRFELRFGDDSDLARKLVVARTILPHATDFGYLDVSVPERPVAGSDPQVSG